MGHVLDEGSCAFQEGRSSDFGFAFVLVAGLSFIFDYAPKVHVFFLTFVFLFEGIHKGEIEDLTVTLFDDLLPDHVFFDSGFIVRADSRVILRSLGRTLKNVFSLISHSNLLKGFRRGLLLIGIKLYLSKGVALVLASYAGDKGRIHSAVRFDD